MTKYFVLLTPLARKNRIQIFSYIADNLSSPLAAKKILLAIDDRISKLDVLPGMFTKIKVNNSSFKDIRYVSVHNYNIFFRVYENEKKVIVLSVQHCSRSIESFLTDL